MSTSIYEKDLHFTKEQILNHLKNSVKELEECVNICELHIAGVQIDIDFEEKTVTFID